MRTIYLSPHLDDAILSAGGLIFDQTRAGLPVEIWTFMCGSPGPEAQALTAFARHMHGLWGTNGAEETVRIRREEDRRAAALVGARAVHFDFVDCIYRRARSGEPLYPEDVFVPRNDQDAGLPAKVARAIMRGLMTDDTLVCQLGIGGHVDHIIVREAAELAVRLGPPQRLLTYDGDIPYLLKHRAELALSTAGMRLAVQPISEAGLGAWLRAIEAYTSQLSSLFEDSDSMRDQIRAYWSEVRGIGLWTSESEDLGTLAPAAG